MTASHNHLEKYLSAMAYKRVPSFFFLFLLFLFPLKSLSDSSTTAQSWVRAGYHYSGSEVSPSDIKSSLFNHLLWAFAYVNSSNYKLSINSSTEQQVSTFVQTVKTRNPSVKTLLSIWVGSSYSPIFFSMVNQSSYRESFIQSSLHTARLYGFDGLDTVGIHPSSASDMANVGDLLNEWRAAIIDEAKNSSKPELIMTMAVHYRPVMNLGTYPIDSMHKNLDWAHITAYDYHLPSKESFTGFHAALHGPSGMANTDYGIKEWKRRGFLSSKLVLGLPYHGFAWMLVNPDTDSVGAPASGPALTRDGSVAYKLVKSFIRSFGDKSASVYNATYVVNHFRVASTWINFDDVEAIRTKVLYAKNNGLLGYIIFQVGNDDNWLLSRTALAVGKRHDRRRFLIIGLLTTLIIVLILGTTVFFLHRKLKSVGLVFTVKRLPYKFNILILPKNLNRNPSDIQAFKYKTIKAATKSFSIENKLGEGGFGTVYKGILWTGQEIAVKRQSKTSQQGQEEFKNEVTLTAKLQHVNLVRVLGYCTEKEEKMLVYEYMPNKSLDNLLFGPNKQSVLDWGKRVKIIEGVTQGLLYLQEYSNFTIIHRDLKASNVLLDKEMNPKISDFGIARVFRKDELEANTGRIVGTYGYAPPEYVKRGIYSMKYDVYSFGVLLLQIISGKRNSCYYGTYENMNLLEYAYELWRKGEGMEFIDLSLDDSTSPCKIMRCMQVALLCVQENPEDRPSVLEVSSMLKNESAAISTPQRPAFSVTKDEDKEEKCIYKVELSSFNDVTISQMAPR